MKSDGFRKGAVRFVNGRIGFLDLILAGVVFMISFLCNCRINNKGAIASSATSE